LEVAECFKHARTFADCKFGFHRFYNPDCRSPVMKHDDTPAGQDPVLRHLRQLIMKEETPLLDVRKIHRLDEVAVKARLDPSGWFLNSLI